MKYAVNAQNLFLDFVILRHLTYLETPPGDIFKLLTGGSTQDFQHLSADELRVADPAPLPHDPSCCPRPI